VDGIGSKLHTTSDSALPLWHSKWPAASKKSKTKVINVTDDQAPKVIYFASCASRTMGPAADSSDRRSLTDVAHSVFAKAGYQVITPDKSSYLCCGMPFHSKGAAEVAYDKGQELINKLVELSCNGEIPIVFDTSPCNLRIKEIGTTLPIYELTDFCSKYLVDKLDITPKKEAVALHITCSSQKAGIADSLRNIANTCASEVIEPDGIACCGFAGDKGLFMPELNQSALETLSTQVKGKCSKGYSNSRTCEIGLSKNSGIDYQSLIYLVDEVSSPAIK
jgi:D-lactate dehydrogenase